MISKNKMTLAATVVAFGFLTASYVYTSPGNVDSPDLDTLYEKLSTEQKHSPQYAVAGLQAADGLQATLFAAEPTLTNPTNIDVDHLGRVWVCEAYNYRPAINGNPTHPQGDRILILEDTNGDGKSDKTTVFYQGEELNAPLGIWVMGNQAIVSQSPYVWRFTDADGDGKADKKEVIFEGVGGTQHDHGMHAFVFGPDGKFYFNFGNEGGHLLDGKGNPVTGPDGKPIDFKKYKQGMVFRCDTDFKNVEVLGHNFRNNYEVAVDSYGTMWQSDNDDDGNKGVRINYVMPYGNYGYTDEMTGAGWRANRTNMEDSIPFRHWHLNDPGVVPNLLQTGAGSPTGLIVYEGRLLPKAFQDQLIHCDAGPNVVRSYPVQKAGAGYTATMMNLLEGKRDRWFRPSDVCAAPDGSLIIADWYDPGVGGHQAGDQNKGRLYRLAPENTPYRIAKADFTTAAGAVQALQSPNLSTRFLAWDALMKLGTRALPELNALFKHPENPRMRARALWAIAAIDKAGPDALAAAVQDSNADIRITALRVVREKRNADLPKYLKLLVNDPDTQVRRECALALHGAAFAEAPELWATLARQHDGKDRWYLEALGIGAEGQWDAFFKAWIGQAGANPVATQAGKDIVWRSRSKESVSLLASLASDSKVDLKNRLRYFRAFDFNPAANAKSAALLKIMNGKAANQNEINELALRHLDPAFVKQSPGAMKALQELLNATYGTSTYMELVSRYEIPSENARLLQLATGSAASSLSLAAGQQLLRQNGAPLLWTAIRGKDPKKAMAALGSITAVGSKQSLDMLKTVAVDTKQSTELRSAAIRSLSGTMGGEDLVLELLKEGKITGALQPVAARALNGAWRSSVKTEAAKYMASPGNAVKKHPDLKTLVAMTGDAAKGKEVFGMYCAVCHQVNGLGVDFGPKLSQIGGKLPKEALYTAIFEPSAGIGFGYEGFEVTLKDGSAVAGIISSKTETDLMMKLPGGLSQEYKMSQVKTMKQMTSSMMPAGLQDAMTTDELVNLVEYMSSLK